MAIRAEAIGDIFAGDGAVTSTSRSTARPPLLGSKVVLVVADAMAIVLAGLFVVAVRDQLDLASADASSEVRSAEHTSELQSLMRISYAVFCLKKKKRTKTNKNNKKQ